MEVEFIQKLHVIMNIKNMVQEMKEMVKKKKKKR